MPDFDTVPGSEHASPTLVSENPGPIAGADITRRSYGFKPPENTRSNSSAKFVEPVSGNREKEVLLALEILVN